MNKGILALVFGNSIITCSNVSEISDVSDFHAWSSVNFAFWVVMGSCGLASLSEVSELVNVESVEAWSKSGNFSADFSLATVLLNELDESLDT